MYFAIESTAAGREWLAGQPGVSNYAHSRATAVKGARQAATFTRMGAGWLEPHSYPLGNATIPLQFTTTRTFATQLDCDTWLNGILTNHAWFGTILVFSPDGTAMVETYKAWRSTRQVALELADVLQRGVALTLTYRANVRWAVDADYVPSAVVHIPTDGSLGLDDGGGHNLGG